MALRNRRLALAALAIFVALALLHTWPLGSDRARWSRNDNSDTILNEWIVAWVAHQTVHAPLDLFDANIFFPEHRALAFSEHLLVPSLMGAPLFWLGASPVFVFNILLLAGFALTGWAMYLVVARWTGDRLAGIVAGSLMAFNAHTLTRLPHLQAQHVEFLPLVLFTFDSLLRTARWRTAFLLGLAIALQSLCSNYLLVFTIVALVVALLARPEVWADRHGANQSDSRARLALMLVVAGLLAAILVLPFLIPYYLAQHEQGLQRPLEEVALYSATWRDYFATGGRLHYRLWSERVFPDVTPLFPGVTGLALSGVALWSMWRNEPRVRMVGAIGLAGLLLSFGPALPGYAALYRFVPLLQGVRGAARFGYLLLVAVAMLAGLGVAWIRTHWQDRGWIAAVSIGLVVAVNVEALRAPLDYRRFDGIPTIYQRLANEPSAVVAEFPFFAPEVVTKNAVYMLYSTEHWHPILNGYSGFVPESYVTHYQMLRSFPDAAAISALRQIGVTHALVHLYAYEPPRAADIARRLASTNEVTLIAEEERIQLYRVQ